MIKRKRKRPSIHSNLAVALTVVLLVFYLMAVPAETDCVKELSLPTLSGKQSQMEVYDVKGRNLLRIHLYANGQLLCGMEYMNIDQLRLKVKEFIANPLNYRYLPEKTERDIDFFGSLSVSDKHLIYLRCDRNSSFRDYINVHHELITAYHELWNEKAREKWNRNFTALNDRQQKAVCEIYPQRITEIAPGKSANKIRP